MGMEVLIFEKSTRSRAAPFSGVCMLSPQVRQRAVELSKFFGDTQAFFTTRGTADATTWATDAGKLVHAIDEAAAAAKWDDAKASATSLNSLCGTCHTAHREREDDGTYRVKG